MLLFSFEEIHKQEGPCDNLINPINVVLELRLMVKYDKYPAADCAALKKNLFQGYLRKDDIDQGL